MRHVVTVLKTNQGAAWLLPQLDRISAAGASVTVIIPPGPGSLRTRLDQAGYKVVESPFDFHFDPSIRTLKGLLRLRRLLQRLRPDVVFYHLFASALAVRLSTAGMGLVKVHMVAGPLYLESRAIWEAERWLVRLDSHIVAGSSHTAALYRQMGVSPDRLSVVPYGVDTRHFAPAPDHRSAFLGASPETFICVMVAYVYAPKARVHPGIGIKGHDVLLEAWDDLCGRTGGDDKLLLLVGGGFDEAGEAYRQELIARHSLRENPRVLWLDTVEDPRLPYSCADISASPSLSENHGAALEAAAMGVPTIVSDVGGLPETTTSDTGWVVPAADSRALSLTLEQAYHAHRAGQLQTMGLHARELCERHFSHATTLPRLVEVVTQQLSRSGARVRDRSTRAFP